MRSHSKEHLGSVEQITNVRDYLFVNSKQVLAGRKRVLVIDDVCTTGASLRYAGKYLVDAGAGDVTRLSLAMNVGNVL